MKVYPYVMYHTPPRKIIRTLFYQAMTPISACPRNSGDTTSIPENPAMAWHSDVRPNGNFGRPDGMEESQ